MRFPSRRWCLGLLTALLLVGAVALGCALALWPGPGVTEANFYRIKAGMPTEQANAILGGSHNMRGGLWTRTRLNIDYREEGEGVVITLISVRGPDQRFRVAEKRLQRVPLTLGDFLRGRLDKVRRRLRL